MKIAFINPNTHSSVKPPLGLLVVASSCQRAGNEVKIIDANLLNLNEWEILKRVADVSVIGITAMTPTINEAQDIAGIIKETYPDKVLVLGGPHATVFKVAESFDVVVAGEGEDVILHILRNLRNLSPFYESAYMVNLDNCLPDYSLIDVLAYEPRYPHGERQPWTTASVSRGCPYFCSFCSKIFGSVYRAMSSDNVVKLIDSLQAEYGIKDITFYDDEFTLDRGRVIEICKCLVDRDLTWTCEARVNLVDRVLLEFMGQAGCRMIFYGIESGVQANLDILNKRVTLEQIENAVSMTRDMGIQASGYFMLGVPGETKDTMKRTIDFAMELELDHAQFSVCSPLPGSKLFEQFSGDGDWSKFTYLGKSDKYMFTSTSKGLSREDIEEAVERANKLFSRNDPLL